MNPYAEAIANSLSQIEGYLGSNKFSWNGNDYICTPSGTGKGESLTIGGVMPDADLVLTVRRSVFPNGFTPELEDTITYNEKEYTIDTVRENVTGTFLVLGCKDPNENTE